MRPLVSYDDICSPREASPPLSGGPGSPPKKRRKNNYHQGQGYGGYRDQYNNEDYEEKQKVPPVKTRRNYGLKEESRQLTHEEVWDDSALIQAWDAAVEEYEVLNGPDKKWKSEPVNKSALWFNVPPEKEVPSKSSPGPSFLMPSIPSVFAPSDDGIQEQDQDIEPTDPENSRPVDFDTFVPHHDPSLPQVKVTGGSVLNGMTGMHRGIVPPPPTGVASRVTKDEAFEHAMGAWYWAGYWTGIYHSAGDKVVFDIPQMSKEYTEPETMNGAMDGVEQEEGECEVAGDEAPVEGEDLLPT